MPSTRFGFRGLFVFVLALALQACVSGPPRQAFNHQAHAALKRIAVLPMRESELNVMIANNPGYSFGLIGLAIAEANRAPKAAWLREQATTVGFDHLALFRERFEHAMAARGYELQWAGSMVEDPHAKASREIWGLRKKYSGVSGVDALLDVNFGFIGYAAAGSSDSAPYRPTVVITARLLSADGSQVLFADQIAYNSVFEITRSGVTLNADERYRYPEFDAFKAAGPIVIDGLRLAFEASAEELAEQLR